MLARARVFLAWACFAILVAMASWSATLSPSYQKCAADSTHGQGEGRSEKTQEVASPAFAAHIKTFVRCEGVFIDENNGSLALVSTFAIAAFTLTLWRATSYQARLTRESIDLAREEFNAAFRPEIAIQSFTPHTVIKNDRECIGAEITCFNKGRVQAVQFIVRGEIIRTVGAPSGGGGTRPEVATRSRTVNRGMVHQFYINSEYPLSDQAILDSSSGQARLYCVGLILYSGQWGSVAGQTGFCRIWESQKQQWQDTNLPGFEFEL